MNLLNTIVRAGLGLCLCLCNYPGRAAEASLPADGPQEDVWSFDIVPYLWLAHYDGTVGLPGVRTGLPPVHAEANSSFESSLSAAFMLGAQVRFHDFGLMFDGAWVQIKTEGQVQPGGLLTGEDITTDIAFGTLALSYRLPAFGKLHSEVFAGARQWYMGNDIELHSANAGSVSAESSRTWTDPILGASLRYDLSKRWFATVLGDAGGFGAGSEITWSVFGGVGFNFTTWLSATLGYRYLHVDYHQDNFVFNTNIQGLLLGLGYHF